MIRKAYEYQTIQQFVAGTQTKERRTGKWAAAGLFLVFGLMLLLGLSSSRTYKSAQAVVPKADSVIVTFGDFMISDGTTGKTITVPKLPDGYAVIALYAGGQDHMLLGTEDEWQLALNRAMEEWGRNGVRVPRTPHLKFGKNLCSSGSSFSTPIACALQDRWQINVVGSGPRVDKFSIMLHETAHLFGVPHMDDDPLMERSYGHAVKHPTPASVAVATMFGGSTFQLLTDPDGQPTGKKFHPPAGH